MREVGALLSLMIASSAEDCQLLLIDWVHCEEIKLKSDVLLDNIRTVVKQMAKTRVCCFLSWNPSCISYNEVLLILL